MAKRINRRKQADMTPAQYESFRTEMRRLRKENGLTMVAMAEMLGYTNTHLSNIENGKRYPSDELAQDIAELFSLEVKDMFVSADERFLEECAKAGRELIKNRISRGFTINQVAGFLGLPREAYLNYENGNGMLQGDMKDAIDRLYAVEVKVETVEVVKEVTEPCPIGLDAISLILDHLAEMDISVDNKKILFRELSEAKMAMLEKKLFG